LVIRFFAQARIKMLYVASLLLQPVLTKKRKGREAGNALFLILIAVALFAALAYAVTQSGRGGGSMGKEEAVLAAAQITQIGAEMKVGFDRMVLGGTQAASVELEADASCFYECTSGSNCLFSPTGGGVSVPVFPKSAEDHPAAAPGQYPSTKIWTCYGRVNDTQLNIAVGVAGVGADATGVPPNSTGTDAMLWMGWIKKEVCQAINRGLGITGIPEEPSEADFVYTAAPGKTEACVTFGNCANCYVYYHVLNQN
jgi:hypothetical protein